MWMALQLTFLLLQDSWGPRFFVPSRFLPRKHDYFELTEVAVPAPEEVCACCLDDLADPDGGHPLIRTDGVADANDAPDGDAPDAPDAELGGGPGSGVGPAVMRTPCGHRYHAKCLRQWMQAGHQTCPTCRGHLPPED